MAYDNRDSIDFGNNDIPKVFKSIFIPTLLGMIFNVAFTITDGIFVGHGVGANGLACINLIAPIMMVITGLGMMFGIGSSVVAAIHLAKNNGKAARINVTQAYLAGIVSAVVIGSLLYIFPHTVLDLLGVSAELRGMALDYYLWVIPTCLFLMFQIIGEFTIRLDGSPKYAMYANIIPAVINIVLDYTFIIPLDMDLIGAALATDIGTGIGLLMAFYYMIFKAEKLKFYRLKKSITSLLLTLRNVGYMIKLGFSAFIGEFAISVMMLTGNWMFGKYLGNEGIAAFSVICYLFPVVFMIYNAVAQSAQPILSYNYGANLPQRVKETFRHSVTISMVFGGLMTIVFMLFAGPIISIFLQNSDPSHALATTGLPLYALGFVFVAFNISAIGYFQSIEQASIATLLMVLRGILFLVIAFITLPKIIGISGLWLAVPSAEIITFIVAICCFKRKRSHKE